jgi:hypothetical protein
VLKQKPPEGKRGRASAERTAPEPISITAQMRVNEFPGCGLYNFEPATTSSLRRQETQRKFPNAANPRPFSFTPNSAACERVFSLMKFMFGDQQWATLGDYIQSALMLSYNERAVG